MTTAQLARTLSDAEQLDQNHHLWQNGRFWWIAFTVHTPDWRVHRVRFSLKTDDLAEARRCRDRALHWYAERDDCELSLRVKPRRSRKGDAAYLGAAPTGA